MEVIVIPDLHAGEKKMSITHIWAVRSAIIAATERRARLVFIGDMVEMTDVADEGAIVEACQQFWDVLREYSIKTRLNIVLTLGNHDRYLTADHLASFFPGIPFEIHKQWWLKDGVLLHHGHLADVANSHILDHLDRNPDKSLAGIERFIATDKIYREAKRRYHSRNMIDLWALMRFAESKVGLSNQAQLQLYDAYRSHYLDKVNDLLHDREQAQKAQIRIDNRRLFPSELALNEELADNTDTELWAIGQGHWHNPFAASFLTSKGHKPVFFNAGMVYGYHRDPSCGWINSNNPRAKTCRLMTYTDGNWRMHCSVEHQRSHRPYLIQPRPSESSLI